MLTPIRSWKLIAIAILTVTWSGLAFAGGAGPLPINRLTDPPRLPSGDPVVVHLATRILNLSTVDEVSEQFTVSGYLLATWTDHRLDYQPQGPGDSLRTYPADEVWIPKFEFINGIAPHTRYDRSVQIEPDGLVTYNERYSATLSSAFNLRRFPFDTQELLIVVHPFTSEFRLFEFKSDSSQTLIAPEASLYRSLPQWALTGITAEDRPTAFGKIEVPEVRFMIGVARRYGFYLWKVYLPLLLMVVLSWTVFFVDPKDLSSQVQISVTTILTVIAFGFAISVTLPKVSYLTAIDAFFLSCYIFVFLTAIEVTTVHVASRSAKTDLGPRLRRLSRVLLPLAFLVTNLGIALHYFGS